MTRHSNSHLNTHQRNWSFVANPPDVLQPGLQNRRMRKKLSPNSTGALSVHVMTWNYVHCQRSHRLPPNQRHHLMRMQKTNHTRPTRQTTVMHLARRCWEGQLRPSRPLTSLQSPCSPLQRLNHGPGLCHNQLSVGL